VTDLLRRLFRRETSQRILNSVVVRLQCVPHQDRQREDVGRGVVGGMLVDHLRSCVPESPHGLSQFPSLGNVKCGAEVSNLGDVTANPRGDQNIVSLDVAMDVTVAVDVHHAVADVVEEGEALGGGELDLEHAMVRRREERRSDGGGGGRAGT
jgi:hypothetical protein